jgi:type IV pilus assembly protein PilQ
LLSLNFQDIEVRAILQILADFTGLNIVVSDSVKGNLTLRLQNVPWDQALDIILRTKGLSMRQNGNVIFIAPTEEVAAREKLDLESRKVVEELIPLRTEIIQVNYAKAGIWRNC